MEKFEVICGGIASVILLLAVLRYRQHPLPATVRIGAFVLCAGQLFSLAATWVGLERINQLVEGRLFPDDEFNWYLVNGVEVSHEFIFFRSLFNILSQLALAILALGLLRFIHGLVRRQPDAVAP